MEARVSRGGDTTNRALEQGNRAREAARNLKGTRQDGILTARRRNLSKEQAKQDQTASTASDLSEPLTQRRGSYQGMDQIAGCAKRT